ncbi:oligoendopeptidase F [Bacillus licheniformis]|uniref:Oligopeptidase F n=2 Tax=Bacillus licheniformis TaxID=1402 RepID=Q65NS9_BACLD|nr:MULTISPECIES: oligoendopeptidase F [Bacillus]MBJ7886885.1 oligoendopeptidase F [Bacillaceae bacterium HSR45]MBY8348939.1 oligoendopeptidase F [Bacillus sp. PCH94]MDP4137380.1 oligoendopeptidase F [Bacillota bacterium]AAU21932.1 neutral zinc metallopeptidase [Bacillus licheniformis DSM 13 = ATCC 14580]AAU39285.1 oligoendopeptidase YjbG [Bacillus licheniformis DSM 13 = ATCC 14580]
MEKVAEKRPKRCEVPEELTWNLTDLFSSYETWEDALVKIEEDLASIGSFKGRLHEGAGVLLDCLSLREILLKRLVRAAAYTHLRKSEDLTNPVNQADASRMAALQAKINAGLSFIQSEILEFPENQVETYIKNEKGLEPFSKMLTEIMELKPYKLAPETEEALAVLGEIHDAPYKIFGMAKLADMQFSPIQDRNGNTLANSFALYEGKYMFSPDTHIRRTAFDSFTNTLQTYKNTIAAIYETEVKKQVSMSRLRGYESVTHMLLQPQSVTLEMYRNQLDVIKNELAPHMRKYAALKKRVLDLDEMRFCDLQAPLDHDFSPKTTYEQAGRMILDALQVMGPEYTEVMETALTERWVDLADNIGKSTGAFCSSPYGAHPFILMTWTDTMRDAFTLAHELGHAGHFYFANREQRIMNVRPSLYFIEAPSTMNEMLLAQHLFSKTNDPKMKRWVINQLMGTYYHNFVTHLLEGEYQRRVYELAEQGHALTASVLSEQTSAVLSEFWGSGVKVDEGASLTWMRQPHYYMGLYPYTYSAGLTASTIVSQQIKEEGRPAVDRWLNVLKAGGTMKPLDLLKHAGVDMSTDQPIRRAVTYVGTLVDELEKLYDKKEDRPD